MVVFVFCLLLCYFLVFFFFSSRRRHTRFDCDWSSDVCSSDLCSVVAVLESQAVPVHGRVEVAVVGDVDGDRCADRKSTRLNSSHSQISYAVFCLKKKKKEE